MTTLLVLALALAFTSIALAFDSGGNPGDPDVVDPNKIVWTGQGVTDDELDTVICPSTDVLPAGINPNSYLHFVFMTDGGSALADGTTPVLTLGGSGSGDHLWFKKNSSNSQFHFYVPYSDLNALTAYVTFGVNDTGNGSWILTISHGCPGEAPKDLTVSKTATPSFTRTYTWDPTKDVDATYAAIADGEKATFNYTVDVTHDDGVDSDWAVSGTITVHNPNTFDVTGVTITDDLCALTGGTDVTVPAGGDVKLDYSCTFATQPEYGMTMTNTATVTWLDISSPNTSASYSADFVFGEPTTIVNEYVDVNDTQAGYLGRVYYYDPSPTTFTYFKEFEGVGGTCTDYDNTATITNEKEVDLDSADATVKVCVGQDLKVEKTAVPSYDLTYAWDIQKVVVGATSAKVDPGYPATFNYEVSVSHDAGTESNWLVSGKITVTNPNDWEAITADVTDTIDNGGVCVVEGGTSVVVPVSGYVELPYTCTYEFAPDPRAFTNTATAAWEDLYYTPNTSASGSKDGAFGEPTNVYDECVDVTDSVKGYLGKVCVGDANPTVFTYSLSFPGPTGGTCKYYDNTATFTTNDTGSTGSDTATVEVCSWMGRLTPGYWKNHLSIAARYLPLSLGEYLVNTTAKITAIFNGMNCNNLTTGQNAVGCLAGHLLAAKLNVANGANVCIVPTIDKADAYLIKIGYIGPGNTYTLTAALRTQAINLKTMLDNYNNGNGCH